MNKIHKQRVQMIIVTSILVAVALAMILYALKQNINVFITPSQLQEHASSQYNLRLGGVVKENSVNRQSQSLETKFVVTDFKQEIVVKFKGVLPDLFREGKGVIAEGKLNSNGIFIASNVLAKHDENYMPKNVYSSLRKNADVGKNS